MNAREIIARRIARIFKNGDVVNLGVGIPTLVPNFLPEGVDIWLHAENGIVGLGPDAKPEEVDGWCLNASKVPTTVKLGGATVDSFLSFGLIRGGHLDYTVLGAMQVDEKGSLANWIVPGGRMTGMGGAMDLVVGARKVIIATEHVAKDGAPKIKTACNYPLTGLGCVDLIVTDMAMIEVTPEGLVLREVAPGVSVEEVVANTEPKLTIPAEVPEYPI